MLSAKWILGMAALCAASPIFATTYWGGFEDNIGPTADYDYQDLVYTLSGPGLTLNTATGQWFNQSSAGTLNTNSFNPGPLGTPFWNNSSSDGAGGYNIGWCIWGGGACNNGVGRSPGAQYLATSTGGSVNDVYFSATGSVTEQVVGDHALVTDSTLGWELVSGVGGVHLFPSGTQGPVTFDPGGNFILVIDSGLGPQYTSNAAASDGLSHFALFQTTSNAATPEPSTMALLGLGLVGSGLLFRKRLGSRLVVAGPGRNA